MKYENFNKNQIVAALYLTQQHSTSYSKGQGYMHTPYPLDSNPLHLRHRLKNRIP